MWEGGGEQAHEERGKVWIHERHGSSIVTLTCGSGPHVNIVEDSDTGVRTRVGNKVLLTYDSSISTVVDNLLSRTISVLDLLFSCSEAEAPGGSPLLAQAGILVVVREINILHFEMQTFSLPFREESKQTMTQKGKPRARRRPKNRPRKGFHYRAREDGRTEPECHLEAHLVAAGARRPIFSLVGASNFFSIFARSPASHRGNICAECCHHFDPN
jgi:hypothetical protein